MDNSQVLINGAWRPARASSTFTTTNPATGDKIGEWPVSQFEDIDEALESATVTYQKMRQLEPEQIAAFLDAFAEGIERKSDELVAVAASETALPSVPRLAEIELPRTTKQLREAAQSARDRSWRSPILSPAAGIASVREPIPGAVAVFGPNNFPFAYNGVCGGDAAAAIATGHPVIAKSNPGHPATSALLAQCALEAATTTGVPTGIVQLIHHYENEDGLRFVADRRLAAVAFTGSRKAGLALKAAADTAGIPIYLEMSSINPVVVMDGAWASRGEEIADELASSALMATGQFCTSPGLIFASGETASQLRDALAQRLSAVPAGTLLNAGVKSGLEAARQTLASAGAQQVAVGEASGPSSLGNQLLAVSGEAFLADPQGLQTEAFGNTTMVIECTDVAQVAACLGHLEGNLTGSIYSAADGSEDSDYWLIDLVLVERVGRLLNDKPPTGVAVVAAMNHGGPYPATGHPGFTAVGMPTSLVRFTALRCYDNVRDHRLPKELQASNPLGLQRFVDGRWTDEAVG